MNTTEFVAACVSGAAGGGIAAAGAAVAVAVRNGAKALQSATFQGYVLTWSVRLGPPGTKAEAAAKADPEPGSETTPGRSPHANDGWQSRQRGPNGQFLPASPEPLREAS